MTDSASSLRPASLGDRFDLSKQDVLLTGSQALVRMLLLQRESDRRSGVRTAGFVSGYRGSPLGGVDFALWQAAKELQAADIVFQPGVNEDLAATAVWGTQQLRQMGPARVDGVFGMWYGKGPGVDRSGDPIKHANYAGTHPQGGVLAVFGDDHPGKSSTIAHHSEQAMAANNVPVLYPSNPGEIIRFGLLGYALSRYSGCWVGLKLVNETVEQTTVVVREPESSSIVRPGAEDLLPPEGVHFRGVFGPARDEAILLNHRLPLVRRFARANRVDRCTLGAGGGFGILTAGKAHQDVMQALRYLGIDDARAKQLGLAVYKVGLIWPLEPEGLQAFAEGRQELFVVEEKQAFIEPQAAAILYNALVRPRIVGKTDEHGQPLVSQEAPLEPVDLAAAIAERLRRNGLSDDRLVETAQGLRSYRRALVPIVSDVGRRMPYFCSGCPHNTSTALPEGSLALAGIGCHGMAMWAKSRTLLSVQMGGEGANWTGLHHFSETKHVFQNLGDGTYFHSGLLAIRAAVASGANITYKILYNDAVAMTGGQPLDGPISVDAMAHQVLHEGVAQVVVVSSQPERYRAGVGLPAGVTVRHRDALDAVQRELRDTAGCTVLIYEQPCAAQTRRRRKKGEADDPDRRLFINSAVCEGCGDCGVSSGCVSIEALETSSGRKRRINQSSCNKDYSCLKGFCPSFVTVRGGRLRKPAGSALGDEILDALPEAPVLPIAGTEYAMMLAGIGGTGVITVSAILAMAAHLEGKLPSAYDMTGLSQKNGAVFSHLRIVPPGAAAACARLGLGEASVVLAFDMIAALSDECFRTFDFDRTHFLANDRVAATAAFVTNADDRVDLGLLKRKISSKVAEGRIHYADAVGLATAFCADPVGSNLILVGIAAQLGWLPVSAAAIERAIELNATQVELNIRAFRIGRLWVHDRRLVEEALRHRSPSGEEPVPDSLDAIIVHRSEMLARYQDQRYADRFRVLVEVVRQAEQRAAPGSQRLASAVAASFSRLMAYKDEYEVARLYSSPEFRAELDAQFEGDLKLSVNLAPPLFARKDPVTGHLKKREYGPWIFPAMRMLAKFRRVRGTWLDVFGFSSERREERALVDEYEALMVRLAGALEPRQLEAAIGLAKWPDRIRGYGHVKNESLREARGLRDALLKELDPVTWQETPVRPTMWATSVSR
ncbi:MAG: indolepyruvate ferredoxin oxidoreductase family protein [Lautropia sp.]